MTAVFPSAIARASGASRALLVSSCARFMDAEERLRVARGFLRHLVGRPAERAGDRLHAVGKESRFVAPRLGLRTQVARREVGRIRLDEQAIARDLAHEVEEVLAPPLVAV